MNEQETQLKTQHKFRDFLYWNLVVSVPFITACIAIAKDSILWLIFYIITCILLIMVIYKILLHPLPPLHSKHQKHEVHVFLASS